MIYTPVYISRTFVRTRLHKSEAVKIGRSWREKTQTTPAAQTKYMFLCAQPHVALEVVLLLAGWCRCPSYMSLPSVRLQSPRARSHIIAHHRKNSSHTMWTRRPTVWCPNVSWPFNQAAAKFTSPNPLCTSSNLSAETTTLHQKVRGHHFHQPRCHHLQEMQSHPFRSLASSN